MLKNFLGRTEKETREGRKGLSVRAFILGCIALRVSDDYCNATTLNWCLCFLKMCFFDKLQVFFSKEGGC